MRQEKIVVVSMSNRMGGAEQVLQMVASTTGAPMVFLKRDTTNCLSLEDRQQIAFASDTSLLRGFMRLSSQLAPYRKDYIIISSHAYVNAYLGFLKAIGFLKSTLIARESTSIFTRFKGLKRLSYQIAYRLGYPSVELVICQTDTMRAQLLNHNRFLEASKVITQPNPIDLSLVKSKSLAAIPDNIAGSDFICSAGRLIPIKGFSNLIKAFAPIAKERNLKLLILGEGPERGSLQQLIESLDLEQQVLLPGHVENPFSFFGRAKLCVVPSIMEGFPNVLLQMMAVNTSVVTTLCAGGIENIPHISKLAPNDIPGLTMAMEQVLNEDTRDKRPLLDLFLRSRDPGNFVDSILNRVYGEPEVIAEAK